ncbi:MAG: S-methyl-5'-thioadenosine phosphorylase [Candidatus Bathyarchaeia archaeon]
MVIALIGGSGLEELIKNCEKKRVGTPYGISETTFSGELEERRVIFLPRHGVGHHIPPHKVNYRANIWALKRLGAERVISTNAVGAINERLKPGQIIIPHDIIDFTKNRASTFYDGPEVIHIDLTTPYCPEARKALIESAQKLNVSVVDRGVYGCTEGPRFETPAEIRMMGKMGCDVVGMTNSPEAFLARELEMCYASICYVSNMAAGLQDKLTVDEVLLRGREASEALKRILKECVAHLPEERSCPCSTALKEAKVKR